MGGGGSKVASEHVIAEKTFLLEDLLKANKIEQFRAELANKCMCDAILNAPSDANSRTLFYLACRDDKEPFVSALLQNKIVNVNIMSKLGYTPFLVACELGNVDVVRTLLRSKRVNINHKKNYKFPAFFLACEHNRAEVVKLLMQDHRFKIDELVGNFTSFYVACEKNSTEVVSLLMKDKRVDVNFKHGEFYGFYIACKNNSAGVVALLLTDKKVVIDAPVNYSTPFEWACKNKHEETINCFLRTFRIPESEKKDMIQQVAKIGLINIINTYLNDAKCNITELKLLRGAVTAKDNNVPMIQLLLGHSRITATEIKNVFLSGVINNKENIELLLGDDRTDPNAMDDKAPIHKYCEDSVHKLLDRDATISPGAAAFMLHARVDGNLPNKSGQTPLRVACRNGNVPAVSILLGRKDLRITIGDLQEACDWHGVREGHVRNGNKEKGSKPAAYAALIDLLLADARLDLSQSSTVSNKIRAEAFLTPERQYIASAIEKALAIRQGRQFNNAPVPANARVATPRAVPVGIQNDVPIMPSGPGIIPFRELKMGKKLGAGGFGIVYAATWQGVTPVAVKQLQGQELPENVIDEFRNEAQNHANLRHPNVVTLYGVCIEPMKYGLVMELMTGGTLSDALESTQAFSWKRRFEVSLNVASGILYLHTQRVLHRDLKTLNILLDETGRAKLSDFGLSKVKNTYNNMSGSATIGGVGTVRWMAPELLNGAACTNATDIYAFGIVLWEIASRKFPYYNIMENSRVQTYVLGGGRDKIPADTPANFTKLINRCWSQKAQDRPTIEEIVRLIQAMK